MDWWGVVQVGLQNWILCPSTQTHVKTSAAAATFPECSECSSGKCSANGTCFIWLSQWLCLKSALTSEPLTCVYETCLIELQHVATFDIEVLVSFWFSSIGGFVNQIALMWHSHCRRHLNWVRPKALASFQSSQILSNLFSYFVHNGTTCSWREGYIASCMV